MAEAPISSSTASADAGSDSTDWIILSNGRFKTGWLCAELAVALYIMWVTPVRLGFNTPAEGPWFWLEGFIDLFFCADLVLNFFTAYEDPATAQLVTGRRAVLQHYLRGWFTIDLLASCPVDQVMRAAEGSWVCSLQGNCSWIRLHHSVVHPISLLRLLRIFRILWILRRMQHMTFAKVLQGPLYELPNLLPLCNVLELVVILMYLGHISGCLFYLVSTPPWQTPGERALIAAGHMSTWVLRAFGGDRVVLPPTELITTACFTHPAAPPSTASIKNSSTSSALALNVLARLEPPRAAQAQGKCWVCPQVGYEQVDCLGCEGPPMRCRSYYDLTFRYVTAMYWAYTTMTTVGYGDVSCTTLAEKIWAIVTMIVGGFFFTFTIGRMAIIIAKLDARRMAQSERLDAVTAFVKDTNLPQPLSKRVLRHFLAGQSPSSNVQGVLNMLPMHLRSECLQHMYGAALQRVPVLHDITRDEGFVANLCSIVHPYSCSANTLIYQRGQPRGDVFILLHGQVLEASPGCGTAAAIPEGTFVGEGQVLRPMQGLACAERDTTVWCSTPCELLRINQHDMHSLMQQYPQLLELLTHKSPQQHQCSKPSCCKGPGQMGVVHGRLG